VATAIVLGRTSLNYTVNLDFEKITVKLVFLEDWPHSNFSRQGVMHYTVNLDFENVTVKTVFFEGWPTVIVVGRTSLITLQRSGDITACATRMLQFSSEMQKTWHTYYPRPQALNRT
jgi:hypothetical protein